MLHFCHRVRQLGEDVATQVQLYKAEMDVRTADSLFMSLTASIEAIFYLLAE